MPEGVGEVQDFMPPPRSGAAAHRHRMIRRILAVRGQVRFLVHVAPRFEYARARPRGRAHPARRALPLSRADTRALDSLPVRDRRGPRRSRAHRAPGRGDRHLRARPRRARRDASRVLRRRRRG
jgi:hypothetical protein